MFHIMVVEDDTELRDLFCAVLTERGYQTLPAATGWRLWIFWSTATWI